MLNMLTHTAEGCNAALCKRQTAPDCTCSSPDPDEQKHIHNSFIDEKHKQTALFFVHT